MPDKHPDEDPRSPGRTEKELFFDALEIEDATERAAWLEEACGDDADLLARVLELLKVEEEDHAEFLEPDQDRLDEAVSAVGHQLREDDPEAETMLSDPGEEAAHRAAAGLGEQPGDLIGRYELLERIGEGGMGVVWRAQQREPVEREVALKVIKLGMDTEQVVARFEGERQTLALMDHPNIAQVYDGGATEEGRPYFVMELVRGIPITEYCAQENLDTRARLELFRQACAAIGSAHQKGIIHRDIKPSNVMVTSHDGVAVPKVIDFGIAKATEQNLSEQTLFTQLGQMVGTPAYMSPEQAGASSGDIDTRSDIYSLGVLLYQLLTGTTPFEDQSFRKAALDEVCRIIRRTECLAGEGLRRRYRLARAAGGTPRSRGGRAARR